MAVEFPAREELKQSGKADVRSELVGSNPFLKNSWIGSIVVALAFLLFDFYEQIKESLKQFFWDTAELPFLSRWAAIFGVTTLPATQATGNVVAQGVSGSSIPISSQLAISGIQYITTVSGSITTQLISVTLLARFGGTVTITTPSAHGWASGISVLIAGAVETEYNGTVVVTVTGLTAATYEIETTPSSPATGTITASVDIAVLPVQADADFFGSDTNQSSGASLSFVTPLIGVNNATFVDFSELTGGSDQETTEDNRIRFLDRVQNPVANFNVAAIRQQALTVAGNTRIFIDEVTPALGQVTIYFTRDNDGIIPTSSDVTRTKDKILEIKPATTDDADVIVSAPTPKNIDFSFSAIDPNTTTMQDAVNANLDVMFEEKTGVGQDLTENQYKSAIQNTIDKETGEFLSTFTLSSPTGDVSVAPGEIPFKGTVSFS